MKFDIENYEMNLGKVNISDKKFINRDISWVDFNKRVLDCALDKRNPLNERLNFLSITESNLTEFISVRFSDYFNSDDKDTYKELLRKIKKFKNLQSDTYDILYKNIKSNGFHYCKLENERKDIIHEYKEIFLNEVFPRLVPINITDNDILLESSTTYISVIIKKGNYESLFVIPIISTLQKIYTIKNTFVTIDDLIIYFMSEYLFINQNILDYTVFRVIKDASVLLSHDRSKFIVDRMEETIYNRKNGKPVFLYVKKSCSEYMCSLLMNYFKIPKNHICEHSKIIDYTFMNFKLFDNSKSYEKFEPFIYENNKNYYNIFDALDNEDILLHHPYDSFDTVVKFIEHSATDKYVESIRMTLYRVSGIDSPIVNALCEASYNGKNVTVLVEIKARFDEEHNIRVIKKLKKAGVTVLLGDEWLKTHCKLCIVTRRTTKGIKVYSHMGTGNYNEKTAKIYTDLSYMTSKTKIGMDLLHVFNIISGYSRPDDPMSKIYYAPVNLRKRLEYCIDREIKLAKKGKKAVIIIKVNSISDESIVKKIYEAADNGVSVNIICRGVCSLIPRKNLKIKSIVGRFLEHSRIYYFRNDGKNDFYISSADLLSRNLDRRVETLINVTDKDIQKQLSWILKVLIKDEVNSFIQNSDNKWKRKEGNFDAHEWMIEYSDIKKQKKSWN